MSLERSSFNLSKISINDFTPNEHGALTDFASSLSIDLKRNSSQISNIFSDSLIVFRNDEKSNKFKIIYPLSKYL